MSAREIVRGLGGDLTSAIRQLRRNPLLSVIIVVVLALPTGALTAVSSVVRAVLLDALPYPDPDRLLKVTTFIPRFNTSTAFTPALYVWRRQSRLLEDIAGYQDGHNGNVTSPGEPSRVSTAYITSNFLNVLRVKPFAGRDFAEADERPGASKVALLSHAFWVRRFGSQPNAIGSLIVLNGVAHEVRGVLPAAPGFRFPGDADPSILIPLESLARPRPVALIARARPGYGTDQVQRELEDLVSRADFPAGVANAFSGLRVEVMSFHDSLTAPVRMPLLLLVASAALVLVVACANVASLQLARGHIRRKEMAVRLALGAGNGRIVRQLSIESLLLAACGGIGALMVAAVALRALPAFSSLSAFPLETLSLDPGMLVFTFAVVALMGQLFGLAAAAPFLRETVSLFTPAPATTWGRRSHTVRAVLVTGQIALAFASIAAAGLLIRSFTNRMAVPLGFNAENVFTASLSGERDGVQDDGHSAVLSRVLERVTNLPGVQAAGLTNALPLSGGIRQIGILPEGAPTPPPGMAAMVEMASVSPNYMKAMQMRLLSGRDFIDEDRRGTEPVLIVNEAFGRRFFSGQEPVGKRVHVGTRTGPWSVIVGLVGDVRQRGPEEEVPPQMFMPYSQWPVLDVTIAVRTASDSTSLARSIHVAIQSAAEGHAVHDVSSMEQRLASAAAPRAFITRAMSAFALLILLLSIAGVFGLTTSLVGQRSRELAIRAALGAWPALLRRLVVQWSAAVLLVGIGLGGLVFFFLSQLLVSLLFGITRSDWLIAAAAAALIAAAVLGASALPTYRAGRVDLVRVLRHE